MTLSVPYSFVPGSKAKAGEVNANFISVLNDIEELNSRFITESERVSNALTTLSNESMKKDFSNIDSTAQAILDAKANLDLSNTNFGASFSEMLQNVGIRTVIKTYKNGYSQYRIYSDGWCEQFGSVYIPSNTYAAVSLIIPYVDTNYFCIPSYIHEGTSQQGEVNIGYITVNGFTIYAFAYPGTKLWYTAGYIDLEALNEL